MTNLDNLKNTFSRQLDERVAAHEEQFQADLETLRDQLLQTADHQKTPDQCPSLPIPSVQPEYPPLKDLGRASHPLQLQEMDRAFLQSFNLDQFFSDQTWDDPTIYATTLADFYLPEVNLRNISPQARQAQLYQMVAYYEDLAQESGGGTLGYFLPGQGCFLNGWLMCYGQDVDPVNAFDHPELAHKILGVAIHEKLGHSFLGSFSELGRIKIRLGLYQAAVAYRFGQHLAEDPTFALRLAQYNLLQLTSQFLEEGWATWITGFIGSELFHTPRPFYQLEQLWQAIDTLPLISYRRQRGLLLEALQVIFGPDPADQTVLHRAIITIVVVGAEITPHFAEHFNQDLSYVVGELLFTQAESNLGPTCLPYAALIAGNVTLDPTEIGLSDLEVLLNEDPRLHPDARLAALSRMRLAEPNSVSELVGRAEAQLSFTIPPELKRSI
jgi:hypothetical protein